MINFLLSVVVTVLCGFAAHEGIKIGNEHIKDLDMSPNIGAIIGILFGVYGVIGLALYGVIKVMIKRMIKH